MLASKSKTVFKNSFLFEFIILFLSTMLTIGLLEIALRILETKTDFSTTLISWDNEKYHKIHVFDKKFNKFVLRPVNFIKHEDLAFGEYNYKISTTKCHSLFVRGKCNTSKKK